MEHLKDAQLVIIPSVWVHLGEVSYSSETSIVTSIKAGESANPTDVAFLTDTIREFLAK